MEEAVGQGIDFEPCDCGYRIIIHMAHHVMPLKNLMQNYAVDEASEPEPIQQS